MQEKLREKFPRVVWTYGAVGLLGLGGFWAGSHLFSQQIFQSTAHPFIATIEKRLATNETDAHPTIRLLKFGRRSDRSFVQEIPSTAPDGSSSTFTEIFDVTTSKSIILESVTRSKVTFQYSPPQFASILNALEGQTCPSEITSATTQQDNEVHFGHSVQYTKKHMTSDHLANGKASRVIPIDEEKWVAPDLNCFIMKEIDIREDGPRTETRVTNLEEKEPPNEMFEAPIDYVERSPRQMEDLYRAKFPGSSLYGDQSISVLEERYRKLGLK